MRDVPAGADPSTEEVSDAPRQPVAERGGALDIAHDVTKKLDNRVRCRLPRAIKAGANEHRSGSLAFYVRFRSGTRERGRRLAVSPRSKLQSRLRQRLAGMNDIAAGPACLHRVTPIGRNLPLTSMFQPPAYSPELFDRAYLAGLFSRNAAMVS